MIYIVLFHLNICANGYVGVDVLFFISGFLVKNKFEKDNIDYLKFISNRLIRINKGNKIWNIFRLKLLLSNNGKRLFSS